MILLESSFKAKYYARHKVGVVGVDDKAIYFALKEYSVILYRDGRQSCTCVYGSAYSRGRDCSHIKAAKQHLKGRLWQKHPKMPNVIKNYAETGLKESE